MNDKIKNHINAISIELIEKAKIGRALTLAKQITKTISKGLGL